MSIRKVTYIFLSRVLREKDRQKNDKKMDHNIYKYIEYMQEH